VGQALHLYNGQTLNEKLKDPKSRLTDWLARNLTDEELVQQLFQLTLARSPTAAERAEFVETLTEASQEGPTARREALEDLFWAVLTGNEFLFNH
jgi:transcription termination factor NusB